MVEVLDNIKELFLLLGMIKALCSYLKKFLI